VPHIRLSSEAGIPARKKNNTLTSADLRLTILLSVEKGEKMITVNVLQRTFCIKVGNSIGTCFALDFEGRQYLVTARHVVESLAGEAQVSILREGWQSLSVILVGHGQHSVDVSVLAPSVQLSRKDLPLSGSIDKITFAQDVYFLGFPHGLHSELGVINRKFPVPFVRKALLSAIITGDDGEQIFLLDGHGNPGFSGGPVVFSKLGRPANELTVAGVVSGHHVIQSPVLSSGEETSLRVEENAGIVISYDIQLALDLIKANPIGVLLK
jgi:hypothetical protein